MLSTGRAPGRPAEFDRAQALDAIVGLFWLRGYDGATQEALRAATGLSSSSLFRSFGTKTETFQAALRRYLDLSDAMLDPLEQGSAGVGDLHALLDRIDAQLGRAASGPDEAAGCLVVATVQDPINRDPRIAALTQRHLARMRGAIGAAVLRAHAAGEHLPAPPQEFTDLLYAAALGMLVSARTGEVVTTRRMIAGVRALLPPATGPDDRGVTARHTRRQRKPLRSRQVD